MLDGNAYIDAIANSVDVLVRKKKIPVDPIVVGIGYENAYLMDSLRNRDYTFPIALPADSFKISGNGDKFYNFLQTRVINWIDSTYRTDKTDRTIMGHSLGGYFVLYVLSRNLADSVVFNKYVAASPSIYYHNDYVIDEIAAAAVSEKNIKITNLYLTIGELEVLENQSNDFKKMSKVLMEKSVNFQTEVYKNSEHMGTAIPSFEDGIQLLTRSH
jgi:predicted alpha/beta superfamily hydrolase